jgi:glutathione peroxidase
MMFLKLTKYLVIISVLFIFNCNNTELIANNLHNFSEKDIKGNLIHMSNYKGKVVLIVNVASKCGYTGQYKELQELYEKYEKKGLVILGFPSNDFGSQEPGSNEEIANFCKLNYNVSFPMMSKTNVTGKNKNSIYNFLTQNAPEKGEISWNFEKFLINKKGIIEGRYKSSVLPTSKEIESKIDKMLLE